MDRNRLERIRPCMQSYVDSGEIHGISTLVAHRGEIVWHDSRGWQDKEASLPLNEETIFRIYSMTKPIICTALMLLYEKGFFQLKDPVSKFLPSFTPPGVLEIDKAGNQAVVPAKREITLLDLFTHTSGLSYDFLEEYPVGALYRKAGLNHLADRSLEEMVHVLSTLPLAFHPGTRWHYSLSTDVLARVIEVLTNTPLEIFLKENLFEPLGMHDTAYHVPSAKRHRCAVMYGVRDFCDQHTTHPQFRKLWQSEKIARLDVSQTYPMDRPGHWARGGIGLFSTTQDFFKFAQMLLNQGCFCGKQILKKETIGRMHTNYLPESLLPFHISNLSYYYGYGFGLGSRVLLNPDATRLPGSTGEFGWYGAARTYYWVDPVEELIGIVMAQYMLGPEKPERELQVLVYEAL